MKISPLTALTLLILSPLIFTATAFGHTHTHIGVNKDAADNPRQLWIFATGSQHQWPTIEMYPIVTLNGGLTLFQAELECWHTAHPQHGRWQLGGSDPDTPPAWDISLKRISFSDNFRMVDSDTGLVVLENDGDLFNFPSEFSSANFNENEELGAWRIHHHLYFQALASEAGEIFTATFTVIDMGTTGYDESQAYTFTFVTVPEPMTIGLLGLGALIGTRRRR